MPFDPLIDVKVRRWRGFVGREGGEIEGGKGWRERTRG